MAKFFKSAWVKCTLVLLAISCIAGGLLAVLNDVLFVTAEERRARAMVKLYGESIEIDENNIEIDIDSTNPDKKNPLSTQYGNINKLYYVGDNSSSNYDIIFQTEGIEGYKGGTITLWIKVTVSNENPNGKIDKIVLESYNKQTLMSKLDSMYYNDFIELYQSGKLFTVNKGDASKITNVVSGATKSSNASCNAVNCVIDYLSNNLGGD